MAPSTQPFPKTMKGKAPNKAAGSATNSGAAVKKPRSTGARNGIPSKPTRYNTFIKENHATVKAQNPGLEIAELRTILSDMWKTHHTNPKSENYDGATVVTKKK